MKLLRICLLLPLCFLFGCGGDSVDTETSVAEVKQEAESMSVEDLKAKAMTYKSAIESKVKELEPLKEKLAEIPLAEQMGDEAKELQAEVADLTKELADIKERLDVYLDALKAKGEEVKEFLN